MSDTTLGDTLEAAGRDDQRSLLSYYSSETTAHATNLLTLALVGLAAIQILRDAAFRSYGHATLLAGALAVLCMMTIWTAGRMSYWAALTSVVMSVDAGTRGRYGTTMAALHQATCDRVKDSQNSKVTKLSANFQSLDFSLWGLRLSIAAGVIMGIGAFLAL